MTPQPPSTSTDRADCRPRDRHAFAAIMGFAAFAFMLIVPTALRDGDTGWHLAAGAWIVEHGRVPTTDPFSYTMPGHAWVTHEWLAEVAMHGAFRLGGWSGLILLFGAALGALYAILALHLGRWLSRGGVAAALFLVTAGLLPSLLARPHLLALPMLAAWTGALIAARAADRPPSLGWAALLLVWANAHASAIMGLGIAAVFAGEALLAAPPAARWRVATGWGLFGLVSLAAVLLTPSFLDGLLYPFQVGRLRLLAHLSEWQPADFSAFSGAEMVLLATLFVLLVRPTRVPPVRLALLLGLLHLSLQQGRQEMVLVVVGALLLAEPIGRAGGRGATGAGRPRDQLPALVVVALLALGLSVYRLAVPVVRIDSPTVPATAIARLPAVLRQQRVFNEYSFGGSLILAGVRPYIDGRSDMYGDAFSLDYFRIERGDPARWRAAMTRWRFGWTILSPRNRLVALLDADPRWCRAYRDAVAVVHVRRNGGSGVACLSERAAGTGR